MAHHQLNTAAFDVQVQTWEAAGLNPNGDSMVPSWVAMIDIGQGATNAVFNADGQVILYYDFGGGAGTNRFTFPRGVAAHLGPSYCSDAHPVFLLSHWDWDHWRGIVPAIGTNSIAGVNGNPLAAGVANGDWAAREQPMGGLNLAARLKVRNATEFYERTTLGGAAFHDFGQFQIIQCNGAGINDTGFALRIEDPGNAGQFMLLSGDADFTNIPAHGAGGAIVSIAAKHHGDEIVQASIPLPLGGAGIRTVGYSFGTGNKYGHARDDGLAHYVAQGYAVLKQTSGRDGTAANPGPRGNLVLPFTSTPAGPGIPAAANAAAYNTAGLAVMASAAKAAGMAAGVAVTPQFAHAVAAAAHQSVIQSGNGNAVAWAAQIAAAAAGGPPAVTPMGALAAAAGADLAACLTAAPAACAPLAAAQPLITAIADILTAAHSDVADRLSTMAGGGHLWWPIGSRSKRALDHCYPATVDGAGQITPVALTLAAGPFLAALPGPAPPPAAADVQLLASHAAFRSARLAMGKSGNNAESPHHAAASIYTYLAGLGLANVSNEICVQFAAGAAVLPYFAIRPEAGAQGALTAGQQAIVSGHLKAAIAGSGAAMANAAANHAQCATVAVTAARAARGAAAGLPQPGCHRFPATCAGNCTLTTHY